MRRSNTVRIIAGKDTKAKLTALGKAFVDCWNEVNKLRLEQYKKRSSVAFPYRGSGWRSTSTFL